jgi:hypothetical protein
MIILTLLSLSLTKRSMKVLEAAFTAVGAAESDINVPNKHQQSKLLHQFIPAASY